MKLGERGQVVKAFIVVVVIFFAMIVIQAVFAGPMHTIWGVAENNTPSNAPDSIFQNLEYGWVLFIIIPVLFVVVWFFAKVGQTENEYDTFYKILTKVWMEVNYTWL